MEHYTLTLFVYYKVRESPLNIDLLQNDSNMDENGVAAAILPLATSFCRVSIVLIYVEYSLYLEKF